MKQKILRRTAITVDDGGGPCFKLCIESFSFCDLRKFRFKSRP